MNIEQRAAKIIAQRRKVLGLQSAGQDDLLARNTIVREKPVSISIIQSDIQRDKARESAKLFSEALKLMK